MSGFTLIEVGVATLVLMVGILGVTGMQLVSYQTNQSAYYRSQATYIAADILERIRLNPNGYGTYNGADTSDAAFTTTYPDPSCATNVGGCTPTERAQQDLREWGDHFVDVFSSTDFRAVLPNGKGVIAQTAGTKVFTVTVSWKERDWDTSATGQKRKLEDRSVVLTAELD